MSKQILTMNAEFRKVLDKVILDEKAKYDGWIQELKSRGIRFAMPDDGWVNREEKCLHFAYPYMSEGGITKGVIVALGWPDHYRLVKLTGQTRKRYFPPAPLWWYYEELEAPKEARK